MKNNDLPSIKEFRRILSIANENPALAATLRSLRNAWLLCDTDYVNTHSEFEQTKKEMYELEQKYIDLQRKHRQLENQINDMDDISKKITSGTKHTNFDALIKNITKTYKANYNKINIEDVEGDVGDDCDYSDFYGDDDE